MPSGMYVRNNTTTDIDSRIAERFTETLNDAHANLQQVEIHANDLRTLIAALEVHRPALDYIYLGIQFDAKAAKVAKVADEKPAKRQVSASARLAMSKSQRERWKLHSREQRAKKKAALAAKSGYRRGENFRMNPWLDKDNVAIVRRIKGRGPVEAPAVSLELTEKLGRTVGAVRQHISRIAHEKLVVDSCIIKQFVSKNGGVPRMMVEAVEVGAA